MIGTTAAVAALVLLLLFGSRRRMESGNANVVRVFGSGADTEAPRSWAASTLANADLDPKSAPVRAIRELRRAKPPLSLAGAVALFHAVRNSPAATA